MRAALFGSSKPRSGSQLYDLQVNQSLNHSGLQGLPPETYNSYSMAG